MAAGLHLCALQWNKRKKTTKLPRLSHTRIATLITVKVVQHIPSIPPLCQSMFAASKAELAKNMLRSMPERAKAIIVGGDFGGTDLVRLDSEIHRPSFKGLKLQGHQSLKLLHRNQENMVVVFWVVSNLGCMVGC